MPTLDFIVQPSLACSVCLAADAYFLRVVGVPSCMRSGVLRVYAVPGAVVSMGRYHLVANPVPPSHRLVRRFSGGRAIPFGDGFVGLALVLPHRSALYSDDPTALAPHQVMNRYVRGILEGGRLVNIPAFYPGRDFITVGQRVLGLVSFEVNHTGALLFEAIIANTRDFSVLPALLDRVDPSGVIKAEMLMPDSTTCLAHELGTELTIEEVADLLRRGYENQFRLRCEPHTLTAVEHQAIEVTAASEFHDGRWLRQRVVGADLDRRASARVQLGVFETYFALEQGRFIKDILFAGDFIANSPAIRQLEHDLRGCPAEWRAINAVTSEIFSRPENYILGIGREHTITDTICKGITS
jgi:lipoate-protein ligase A